MENIPLFSIVIPSYNRAHLIENAVWSVISQIFQDWELILVDDCSTDNTENIVAAFHNQRIRYFKLPVNKGNAGARNEGVKAAKGEYIVFLDSDDLMEPDCLTNFYDLVSIKRDTAFAFGGYEILDEESGLRTKKMWKPIGSKSFLEELKIGTGCGIMVKKTCFDTIGYFDERLRVAVDTDWLIRLEEQFDYKIIDNYLVTVVKHKGERVRNNKTELLKSYKIIFDKNKERIYSKKSLISKFYYKLQWLSYQDNKKREGNVFFLKQMKGGVFSIKSVLTFVIYNFLPLERAKSLHLKLSGSSI